MIIDTSALVAILKLEPGYEAVAARIAQAPFCRISTASLLELWIVTSNPRIRAIESDVTELLDAIRPNFEPVTLSQVVLAKQAYQQFGKRSGHPAKLNFGDCFAYALAREKNEPLLFVGNDFSHTDITLALQP